MLVALLFVAGVIISTVVNTASVSADLRGVGRPDEAARVWIWEASSGLSWLVLALGIWRAVRIVRPPRFGWPATVALHLGFSVLVSLGHVAIMVPLRMAAYSALGDRYDYSDDWAASLIYEYRKDFVTYLQLGVIFALSKWVIARRAVVPPAEPRRMIEVPEGAVTHRIPIDEIDEVRAAANYVEIVWGPRTLLHRATLSAIEVQLAPDFVRIHRAHLVRRAAIRSVATQRSGDFTVTLASGAQVRGSRRYRDRV